MHEHVARHIDIDEGARRIYEAVKVGIDGAQPWEELPTWRRWRYRKAYEAAVAYATGHPVGDPRQARTRRIA